MVDRDDPSDPSLRARFAALRERDLAIAPEFDALLARAAPLPHRALPMLAWGAAWGGGLLAIAAWIVASPRPTPPATDTLALPAWRMPTDSLLTVAANPSRQSSWATLPTATLGQASFNRTPEIRR